MRGNPGLIRGYDNLKLPAGGRRPPISSSGPPASKRGVWKREEEKAKLVGKRAVLGELRLTGRCLRDVTLPDVVDDLHVLAPVDLDEGIAGGLLCMPQTQTGRCGRREGGGGGEGRIRQQCVEHQTS